MCKIMCTQYAEIAYQHLRTLNTARYTEYSRSVIIWTFISIALFLRTRTLGEKRKPCDISESNSNPERVVWSLKLKPLLRLILLLNEDVSPSLAKEDFLPQALYSPSSTFPLLSLSPTFSYCHKHSFLFHLA